MQTNKKNVYHRVLRLILLGGFLSLLTVLSCWDWKNGGPDSLVEKEWIMTAYEISGDAKDPIEGSSVILTFDKKKWTLGGNSSCNHYGAEYSLQGNNIRISDIFCTEMYCVEPAGIMEQEALYLSILSKIRHWEMEEDALILWNDAGDRLEFSEKF